MGAPMAANLARAGFAVRSFDLRGHGNRASIRDAARGAEAFITMLPDGEAVREAVLEALPALAPGSVVIDMSSSDPLATRALLPSLKKNAIHLLDAPVSGAIAKAKDATLAIMVGGEKHVLEKARPVLAALGRDIFHVGPLGAGHTMKTINNLATAVTVLATAEAVMIGKACGLGAQAMVDVLNVSTGQSFVSAKRLGQDVVSRKFEDQFRLELMLKDMGIATRLAGERGLPVPVSDFGREIWARAVAELGEGRVTTEIVKWYEQRMGFELKD